MGLARIENEPIDLFWKANWDFFTGGGGSKTGTITDLHEGGCILKTVEPIEYRRWIRIMIHDTRTNLSITAIGRVVRCENSFETTAGSDVTLYRYQVEFTFPVPLAQTVATPAVPDVKDGPELASQPA